jgi:predicted RNA-binding Zn ribbon-like protein
MATDEADRRLTAPGDLELVRDFVNTRDLEKGTDRIEAPGGLVSWLVGKGLAHAGYALTDEDVARARAFREALRSMLLANAGLSPEAGNAEGFDAAARGARLEVGTGDTGTLALLPVGDGLDRAIGRLAAIAFAAQEGGSWARLKACAGCRWALYDHTKNRSATWCDAAKCGARARSRRYRARRRGASALGER